MQGKLTEVNDVLLLLLGLQRDEVIGANLNWLDMTSAAIMKRIKMP